MKDKLEVITDQWFKCEITGDEAMSKVAQIIGKDRGDKNETFDAHIEEKH